MEVGHAGCDCGSANTTVGGIQKAEARLAMTARGSVESSRCAHGTRPHIFERHQPGNTVATNNHFCHVRGAKVRMPCCSEEKTRQLSRNERAGSPEWRNSIRACSGPDIRGWWTTSQKQGNEKPGAEGQSGQVLPPYAGRTAIANRIQSPTSEGIQLVPNLGQPITQAALRGRGGGARTDRRCGGVDTRKLHGRSRQQGGRRRCLQESLRGDHLRRGPPIQGSPVEA